jgi:multidrug efflux pump subunit AcrA (membrane-fusion protein)
MSEQSRLDLTALPGDTRTSGRASAASARPLTAGGKRRVWVAAGALAALAVAAGGVYLGAGGGGDAAASAADVGTVRRGTLVASVRETGEVEADKRVVIRNELDWPVIIEQVVEDGITVEANEVIVEFSCKELDDAIRKQTLTVRSAASDLEQARANLELKQMELGQKVAEANQALADANADIRRYVEGEWPLKQKEQLQDIALQEQELALARENLQAKLDANATLGEISPYSRSEIQADQLALERKAFALEKAKRQWQMLRDFDHPKELRRLTAARREAQLAVLRAGHDRDVELRRTQELVAARQEAYQQNSEELERLEEQAAKLTVTAEKKGLVVYDTRRRRWDTSDVTVAKGEKIQPRQQLMIIPDMTTLQIRTQVYEAVSQLVRKGQRATVWLEVRPQEPLTGTVHKISTVAADGPWWDRDAKVYPVIVKLDGSTEGLKPKMSARVELELARAEGAVIAPIGAVFHERGGTFCYRVDDGRGEPRKVPVEAGLVNDTDVQILSGLGPGDRVMLREPQAARQAPEAPGEGVGP